MPPSSVPSPQRAAVLSALADRVAALRRDHPVRVAVDGVDAAGKTVLAAELATVLRAGGRPVVHASIDGFHRPRAARLRRGPESPEGYYLDSFDHEAVIEHLLRPLGPGGTRRFRRAVFDFRTDAPVAAPVEEAPADAVLVVDGVFLQRPELDAHWDYRIFVAASFETTVARAAERDRPLFGEPAAVRQRYERRYVPGQRLYLEACHPEARADAVVGNDDPERPTLRFGGVLGTLERRSPTPSTLRLATIADAPAIAAVHVEGWRWGYRDLLPASLLDGLSVADREGLWSRALAPGSATRVLVVEAGGVLVAFAAWGPAREGLGEATAELYALYQREEVAGSGTGHRLLEAAAEAMRAGGHRRAALWVLQTNARARGFYERHGWRADGTTATEVQGGVELLEVRHTVVLSPR